MSVLELGLECTNEYISYGITTSHITGDL